MKKAPALICLALASALCCSAQTQTGVVDQIANFPSSFFKHVQEKTADLDGRLTKQTEKYLNKLSRQETKLRAKWAKRDSASVARFFAANPISYAALEQKLRSVGATPASLGVPLPGGTTYIPRLDSLKTSLIFLDQNSQILSQAGQANGQISQTLGQVTQLQNKIQVTQEIQALIRNRKEQLRQALSRYTNLSGALQNTYKGYSQQAYYYGAQLQVYRDELSNPDKLSREAFGLLAKQPAYGQFIQQHSDMAGLFSLPGGTGGGIGIPGSLGMPGGGSYAPAKPLPGLQTRAQVNQILNVSLASGGPNASQAISQQVSSARSKLQQLKSKVASMGGGNSNMDMPDFRPNNQHVKTFLQRLTYGINVQSVRSTYLLPATTDIGVSLGYKLTDGNTIGVGASYKMGWGQDIKHIAISSQGVGLRSYLETKIKASFFATAGLEYNYQQPIYSYSQIRDLNAWTRSGLIGVTKKYKISSKMQGNVQLLWDFLSYQQVPKGAPVVWRIGYSF